MVYRSGTKGLVAGSTRPGTTELFDAATMATRHVDRQGYIEAEAEATDRAVEAVFLLPPDAERIRDAASLQWDALGID